MSEEQELLAAPSEVIENAEAEESEVQAIAEQVIAEVASEQVKDEVKAEEEPKSDYVEKRIAKLTRQKKEAEERNALLEKQLASFNKQAELSEQDFFIDPATHQRIDKPNPHNFASNPALYLDESEKYRAKKAQAQQVFTSQAASKQEWEKVQREYASRIPEAKAKYADFVSVVDTQEMAAFEAASPLARDIIMRSELGADLAYYIGKSPELREALVGLNPIELAREIGRMEATIENTFSRKIVSSAKPPAAPGKGSNGMPIATKDSSDPHAWSPKEWRERLKKPARNR